MGPLDKLVRQRALPNIQRPCPPSDSLVPHAGDKEGKGWLGVGLRETREGHHHHLSCWLALENVHAGR